MKSYKLVKFFCVFVLLCSAYKITSAQDFKGIIPIQSTCQDVERILGGEHCGKKEETFTLEQERIRIAYSAENCQFFFGQNWNVPIGTVLIIERTFLKSATTLKDLGMKIDESEYTKEFIDSPSTVIYHKKTGELSFYRTGEYVNDITYYPSNADKELKTCKPLEKDSNGIVMNATCQDVEKLFGDGHCGKESEIIELPEQTIEHIYSTKKCQKFYGKLWDIPIGTIVFAKRVFKQPKTLEELGMKIDESEYSKNNPDDSGKVIYKKKTGEISFSIKNGHISEINYYPSNADAETKLCKESQNQKFKSNLESNKQCSSSRASIIFQ